MIERLFNVLEEVGMKIVIGIALAVGALSAIGVFAKILDNV